MGEHRTGSLGSPGTDHVNTPWGIGGQGGTGHGPKVREVEEPMISIQDAAQIPGLDPLGETMDEFCRRYRLGAEIANLLRHHGFGSLGSFQFVTELDLRNAGFKVGHIAELKWALRKMVGERSGKPELYGGTGGKGGRGGKQAGAGGESELPIVPPTYFSWFTWGRAGGHVQTQRKVETGGKGGKGGKGTYTGGEGGEGEAPQIPIGIVSLFAKIFGGIGGEGGLGGIFGGRGGIGRGSVFHEVHVLGNPSKKTLNAPPLLLTEYAILFGDLLAPLFNQGFVTVGALFMVTRDDLRRVGFNLGQI
ncbi:hypothetical protein C8R45DRAFT_1156688 [Mycena sanguinolenta]|nr:hypothetical protein C8R45DRAFT_1156688 [Mycena sanguinolenta]